MNPAPGSSRPAPTRHGGTGDPSEAAGLRLREETRANLAAIVESSDDAIVSKTLDGIIRTWNAGAQRIFGYTPEEIIGRPITTLIPPERKEEETAIIARLRAGERVDHFETVRLTKDGREITVSVTISPIRDSRGNIIGASKIARDITRQVQIQRELEEAKESAEKASRAKDQFLSVLSHELRTPLTPALGALSYLEQRASLTPDLREEIAMIRRNIETEARLVDDLLDLTRISRGKIQLRFENVDAHAAIQNTVSMFQPEFELKNLHVTTTLRARQHHLWADPGRLQQVFLNLLSNAAKFTPEGGSITIGSETTPQRKLRLQFSDSGIGIDEELLPRIFLPFEQGERTRTRQYGGLGLGLSIARSLVELHRGQIHVSSRGRDQGATFTLEFDPVGDNAAESASDPPAHATTPVFALRVLLVEDHIDTRRVMAKLLSGFGCTVTAVGTVAEAVQLADQQTFDLLISDIGLPDGTGTELIERIRRRQPIRGIAISGFGHTDDLERSQAAGYDAHLVKPINFRTLQKTIQQFAAPR